MKQWSLETVPGNPACCRGRAAVHEEKEERAPFAVAAWARAAPRRPRSGESPGGAGGPPRAEVGGAGCGAGSGAWGVGGREGARVGPAAGRAAAGLRVGPALAEADPGRSRRAGERGGGASPGAGRRPAAPLGRGGAGGPAARGSWRRGAARGRALRPGGGEGGVAAGWGCPPLRPALRVRLVGGGGPGRALLAVLP